MPFQMHTGIAFFTNASILQNAPAWPGVYGLYKEGRWIYVGETDDIQKQLLEHLAETGSCIKREAPTDFVYEIVDASTRVARQAFLIRELSPPCNPPEK
jgi:excinuclease UvrABC nuclease subunit